MKKLGILKASVAVILAVCVGTLTFYGRISSTSRADEAGDGASCMEVSFAPEPDSEAVATDTDAGTDKENVSLAEVLGDGKIECGSVVYFQGEPYTRYYTVYYNGTSYKAYCGDHNKNAVKSTDNVTISETDDKLIRKVFCYGPDSPYAWSGFSKMSNSNRQLIMALTLNYIRHGQYFSVISDFYSFISGGKSQNVWLSSSQAELSLKSLEDDKNLGEKAALSNYKRYRLPEDGSVRKRTKVLKLVGDKSNFVVLGVPKGSYVHIKRNGLASYAVTKSGSVKLNGGDSFFFSAALDYVGSDTVTSTRGQYGVTAYTADSNETAVDQQLLFGGRVTCSQIELKVNWKEVKDYGYMWLSKNREKASGSDTYRYSTIYNGERYGLSNYSLAGISYLVTDSLKKHRFRFILSYDGHCYMDMDKGIKLVFNSPDEKAEYGGRLTYQYAKLPLGSYSVAESDCLWHWDNSKGTGYKTSKPVRASGYEKNDNVKTVTLTKEHSQPNVSKALHVLQYDNPLTGTFSLKKSDSTNKKPVSGAIYYVVRKASGNLKEDKCVAKLKTNSKGVGIVTASLFGGKGSDRVTKLPLGEYTVYEYKAPDMYKKNTEAVRLVLSDLGESIYSGKKLLAKSSSYSITWNTTDEPIKGNLSLKISKQDAGTGEDAQGEAVLEGAYFTVNYYKGYYERTEELPDLCDRSWVIETDGTGSCRLSEEYLAEDVTSDELFIGEEGSTFIPEGTVTVTESRPPTGYTLDENAPTIISHVIKDEESIYLDNGNELVVKNDVVRGDFCFTKRDAESGEVIGDVEFLLENHDRTKSVVIHTDENGYYSSESSFAPHSHNTNQGGAFDGVWFGEEDVDDQKGALPYGTYYLSELRCDANKGKYKRIEAIEFTVDEDKQVVKLGDVLNERMPKIETKACDADSKTQVADMSKPTIKLEDTVTLMGLEVGHSYTLEGEVIDKQTGKRLSRQGTASKVEFVCDGQNMNVVVPFEFSSEGLSGKELVCYQVLTDKAYEGEIIAAHQDINAKGQTVRVREKILHVSKMDITGKDELPGALMAIEDSEGNVVEKWVSTTEPHIVYNLTPGSYILKELSPPAGYLLAEPVPFEISDDDVPQGIGMKDDIARISILKKDDVSNKALSGVEFTLYLSSNNTEIAKGITDENGRLDFHYVSPGEYYIEETKPLDGFIPGRRIDVTIEENQYENIPIIEVNNHYGEVHIVKRDMEDKRGLSGAVFELFDEKGRSIAEATTDEAGNAFFEGLVSGKYSIREKKAPEGYEAIDTDICIDTSKDIYDIRNPLIIDNKKTNKNPGEKLTIKDSPDTGDKVPVVWMLAILGTAIISALGILIYKRKKE